MNVSSSFVRHVIPDKRKLEKACKGHAAAYIVDIENSAEYYDKHGPEGIKKARAYILFALEMYSNVERLSWIKEYRHPSGQILRRDEKVFLIDRNLPEGAVKDINETLPEIKLKSYPVSDFWSPVAQLSLIPDTTS